MEDKQIQAAIDKMIPIEEMRQGATNDHDRLTVKLEVYYEQSEFDPAQVSCSFVQLLPQSQDQIYVRRILVGPEWQALDIGWVKEVGFILVENRPKRFQAMPTEEEQAEVEKKVLSIRNSEASEWPIASGAFFFGKPQDISTVQIRCLSGETQAVVNIFPG